MKFNSFKNDISFTRYLKNSVFCFVILLLTTVSCSKKHYPVSSKKYNPTEFTGEMQVFAKGGIEKDLKTGRKKPKQIIRTAEKFVGTPHCMGGTTKKCMDCSGLIFVSFTSNKISIPRKSQDQARYGSIIFDKDQLKKGDLVFFTKSYDSPDFITHVGIYLGNNRFIHTSTSSGVIVTPMQNSWWSERFVFGTRVF